MDMFIYMINMVTIMKEAEFGIFMLDYLLQVMC